MTERFWGVDRVVGGVGRPSTAGLGDFLYGEAVLELGVTPQGPTPIVRGAGGSKGVRGSKRGSVLSRILIQKTQLNALNTSVVL